jgi:hypothetical protein
VLQAILSGELKNEFGVPYRNLGAPLDCALIVIKLIGPLALALKAFVEIEARIGHPYAAEALSVLKSR